MKIRYLIEDNRPTPEGGLPIVPLYLIRPGQMVEEFSRDDFGPRGKVSLRGLCKGRSSLVSKSPSFSETEVILNRIWPESAPESISTAYNELEIELEW